MRKLCLKEPILEVGADVQLELAIGRSYHVLVTARVRASVRNRVYSPNYVSDGPDGHLAGRKLWLNNGARADGVG